MQSVAADKDSLAGKFLTFLLKGETYGLEILKVQEIMGLLGITHVPRTPDYIRGVFNLRGRVIPVIDLRLKFCMEVAADTERTCIIVLQVQRGAYPITIGIVVDEVAEVVDVRAGQIEATPSFGAGVDTGFILGIGNVGQKVVLLLDANQILSGAEEQEIADHIELND